MGAAEDDPLDGSSEEPSESGRPDESHGSSGVGDDEATTGASDDPDETVAEAEVVGGDDAGQADSGDDQTAGAGETASPPGTDERESAQGDFADPVEVLDVTAQERDEYFAKLRQVQADFENYRKQAIKRQGDAIDHATGRLVEDLLPVFDACDAGIEHGDEGVTAIFTTLLGVLEKAGLERLDPTGEPFDPNAHEAVIHEPAGDDDVSEGPVVAEVMRPGYRWKERTLRAAMVKVRG